MPNVRITCGLWLARPWQPGAMILPPMLLCQGRDGPARQVNAVVRRKRRGLILRELAGRWLRHGSRASDSQARVRGLARANQIRL
jgi:hypothetical protein